MMSIRRTVQELAYDTAAFVVVSLIAARQIVRAGTRVAYDLAVDVSRWAEKRDR